MNRSINIRQIIARSRSPLCLLCLIGLTVFASPVAAQVFDPGPSAPALFDGVVNVPPAPDIDLSGTIGGDGFTTQLNVADGGSVERFFTANSGGEVNINGGEIRQFFIANSGSEVNISGGDVGAFFDARDGSVVYISGGAVGVGAQAGPGSEVNISGGNIGRAFSADSGSVVRISGGSIGDDFAALAGSEVNLVGFGFVLDGVPIIDSLSHEEAFTIVDRDVTLTGRLVDGTAFSFDLNPNPPVFEPDGDYFDSNATLTVTLGRDVLVGDQGDGIVNFLDIEWFICELGKIPYRAEADINQDGFVNFFDIGPLIDLLSGN